MLHRRRRLDRLGRVAGCVVEVHWSALLIVALMTGVAAVAVLPVAAPGAPAVAYWLVSLAAALLILGSLLGHELAHAAVARRAGVPVSSVLVWVLGGVTFLDREPGDPRTELRLSAAGPLASLLTGVAALAVAVQMVLFGVPAVVAAALVWVGVVNAFVAGFSVLPATPLDGARMLHAVVWARRGAPADADRVVRGTGGVLAAALAAGGLAELVLGQLLDGVCLLALGAFLLWTVARDAGAARRAADRVRGRTVSTRR